MSAPIGVGRVSQKQLGYIGAMCAEVGLGDRDDAIAFVSRVACRPIGSRRDLTRDEASWVIRSLQIWKDEGRDPSLEEAR